MATNQEELNSFHEFATKRLGDNDADSLYELLDELELDQINEEQLNRYAQAIQKSVDDMNTGDSGCPAKELLDEFRSKPHSS